jgi:hypothetical protein
VRETRIPIGALLGAIGAVLLIVSLFLDWYEEVSAFTIFEFIDLLLLGLAIVTLVSIAAAVGAVQAALTPAHVLAVSLLALIVVLSQIVNDPPLVADAGADKSTGIWLALGGAALMVAGAVLSSARIAIAVSPRERSAAPPPPADEQPTVRDEPRP